MSLEMVVRTLAQDNLRCPPLVLSQVVSGFLSRIAALGLSGVDGR
jgi:hypothetical protein